LQTRNYTRKVNIITSSFNY